MASTIGFGTAGPHATGRDRPLVMKFVIAAIGGQHFLHSVLEVLTTRHKDGDGTVFRMVRRLLTIHFQEECGVLVGFVKRLGQRHFIGRLD